MHQTAVAVCCHVVVWSSIFVHIMTKCNKESYFDKRMVIVRKREWTSYNAHYFVHSMKCIKFIAVISNMRNKPLFYNVNHKYNKIVNFRTTFINIWTSCVFISLLHKSEGGCAKWIIRTISLLKRAKYVIVCPVIKYVATTKDAAFRSSWGVAWRDKVDVTVF